MQNIPIPLLLYEILVWTICTNGRVTRDLRRNNARVTSLLLCPASSHQDLEPRDLQDREAAPRQGGTGYQKSPAAESHDP